MYNKLPTVLVIICYDYAKEPFGISRSIELKENVTSSSRLITDNSKSRVLLLVDDQEYLCVKDVQDKVVCSKRNPWSIHPWLEREWQLCTTGSSLFFILHSMPIPGEGDREWLDIHEVGEDGLREKTVWIYNQCGATNITRILCEPKGHYTLVDFSSDRFLVFDEAWNFVRSESYEDGVAEEASHALHRGPVASDGCGVWVAVSSENDILFIEAKTRRILARAYLESLPWDTPCRPHHALIRSLCCGSDGLVYVLARVEHLNEATSTHVFVFNTRGQYLRRWPVDFRCTSMIFGPEDRLHILCSHAIFVCD